MGTVQIDEGFILPSDVAYWVLRSEMFTGGSPSTSDADPVQYPQYQLTFFADDIPGSNEIFDEWGNGPNGMVNYRGQDIAIEILKLTMKLDFFNKYGNGVGWDDNSRIVIPESTID